jgi:4-hydroxythreonine-4-phosphate dehydrogenase
MKTVAITMGEPGGIGPEIALKGTASAMKTEKFTPLLVGDPEVFEQASNLTGIRLDAEVVPTGSAFGFRKGGPTSTGGEASAKAITRATELALSGKANAIVTAPISKEALSLAGLKWPGHTEMLAELTGSDEFSMMLMGKGLRVMLVTIHTSLNNVPKLVTREAVLRTIRLAEKAGRMLGMKEVRIGVSGLNPHAGEGGMFGDEELRHIIPAIQDALSEGMAAFGPHPADTVFHRALNKEFDIVVCMYHDQGLGPLKTLAFESGINVTIGLPIIRTSPDHGTAYDIAWENRADPRSMEMAIRAALRLKQFQD